MKGAVFNREGSLSPPGLTLRAAVPAFCALGMGLVHFHHTELAERISYLEGSLKLLGLRRRTASA